MALKGCGPSVRVLLLSSSLLQIGVFFACAVASCRFLFGDVAEIRELYGPHPVVSDDIQLLIELFPWLEFRSVK